LHRSVHGVLNLENGETLISRKVKRMPSARPLLRDCLASLLHTLKLSSPRRRNRGCLTVATFHRVLPEEHRQHYPYPGIAVTPDELRWFLAFFSRRFRCGSLREALVWWQTNRHDDVPPLALTFDDGQLDNYLYARPVLAEAELHATFYIPVANVEEQRLIWHDRLGFSLVAASAKLGSECVRQALEEHGLRIDADEELVQAAVEQAKRLSPAEREQLVTTVEQRAEQAELETWTRLMDWSHLRDLVDEGHEVGSHGMTHALLPQCTDDELTRELNESRAVLMDRLQQRIDAFCYPDGAHDDRVVAAVSQAGYANAVTTAWGRNRPGVSLFRLQRCDVDARRSRDRKGTLSDALTAFRISGFHPGLR